MSKYNKSISLVDSAKLILLDSFAVLSPMRLPSQCFFYSDAGTMTVRALRTTRTTDQAQTASALCRWQRTLFKYTNK